MPSGYKFVFFGSPGPAALILKTLTRSFNPVVVVSQPDRPVGRRQGLTSTPVSQTAKLLAIPILQPTRVSDIYLQLKTLVDNNTFGFLYAYGQIIPKKVLDLFPKGIINLHPSYLPKYRGASPIRQVIIDGQEQTGFSLMLMDDRLDHGPIIYQQKIKILPWDTRDSLWQRITKDASVVVNQKVLAYLSGKIKLQPQDHSQASYTKTFKRQDGLIDWFWSAVQIERFIRAMQPWPVAFTWVVVKGKKYRLKILKAQLTSQNKLNIKLVQLEGKRPVACNQFKTAYPQVKFIGRYESEYRF